MCVVAVLFSQCCLSRRFEWRHYAACALVLTGAVVVRLDELVVARAPRCGPCGCGCLCLFERVCLAFALSLTGNKQCVCTHGLLLVVLQAMLSAATGESRRYASETNATTQKCTAVFTEKMMKRDRPSLDALVRFGRLTRVAPRSTFCSRLSRRSAATRRAPSCTGFSSIAHKCGRAARPMHACRCAKRTAPLAGRQMYICGLPIYAGMTLYSRLIADARRSTRVLDRC